MANGRSARWCDRRDVTTDTVNFGDGKIKEITSPQQLMQEIAQTPKAKQLYAQAWVALCVRAAIPTRTTSASSISSTPSCRRTATAFSIYSLTSPKRIPSVCESVQLPEAEEIQNMRSK